MSVPMRQSKTGPLAGKLPTRSGSLELDMTRISRVDVSNSTVKREDAPTVIASTATKLP